jgi:monoamine oxidase
MRLWNIGIIGGGPGGLITAYSLLKLASAPVNITLFEASSRLGGKILTPRFQAADVSYEAGAAEFYDYSVFEEDALKALIRELGLPVCPMGGPAVVMEDRFLSNLDDFQDCFGPQARQALAEFDRAARNLLTPGEFYQSDDPEGVIRDGQTGFDQMLDDVQKPEARKFIETLIHSDLATEPHQTNMGYGLQNYLMNDPAYMSLYGIVGGNERLPQELASRIAANILLNHQVQSVAKVDQSLRVTSLAQGLEQQHDFDFVIVALPHSHLNSVAFQGDRLTTAVSQHHAHYNFPAHYLRITILFKRAFWRDACGDSYWMLDHFGGCCLYDESSRDPSCDYGVLGWLLAGDAAESMNRLSDDALIAEALASLPSFFVNPHEQFIEARVHRWIGAVNAIPGGKLRKPHDQRHQPEPVEHPNLFVVGDYLFDSTLNGVVDSAQYVAAWIAAQIAEPSSLGVTHH